MAVDLGVSEAAQGIADWTRGSNVSPFFQGISNKLKKIKPNEVLGIPVASADTQRVVYGPQAQNFTPSVPPVSYVNLPKTSVNPTVDTGTSDLGGGGGGVHLNSNDYTDIQSLRDMEINAKNKAYGAEDKRLKGLENRTNDIYGQSIAQAQAYYPEFQRMVGEQQASTDTQLTGQENQRKFESERALGQARQLLNDLSRRQNAQMSASGNYGTSTADAMAESFGRKAYDAQNQVQTSRDQSLNDIANKRVEAKQYFDSKLFEGKQKYDTLITGLKQQLNSTLDQISQARNQSSAAKNAAGVQAWNNYVNNKFSLDQELRSYQTQLAQYTAESNVLADGTNSPAQGYSAPGVNSSNNQAILGDINSNVSSQSSNQFSPQAAPIYSKRRLTPEEEQNLQMSGYGLQLNP